MSLNLSLSPRKRAERGKPGGWFAKRGSTVLPMDKTPRRCDAGFFWVLNSGEALMNRLDGKVALVSGAARGIGAETARLMAEAGAKVAIADVLDERGRDTVRAIENAGGEAMYIRLDVTREEDWNAAITAVTDRFGGLDILVNNAGVFLGMSLEEATLADWHRLCSVNLTGVFLGTKLSVPALRESGQHSGHGGAIVNLASVAGLVGSSNDPLYSMTKGGGK